MGRNLYMPRRSLDLDTLVESVTAEITNCITCQLYEGGEAIWIMGNRTDVDDLLDSCGVPERLKDEVLANIQCPGCGAPIERPCDVGTKYEFEREYDYKLERATHRYDIKLYEFSEYLQSFPYLGASHRLGKEIIRTIKTFPKSVIENQTWLRARRIVDGTTKSVDDLRPPNPDNIAVPEGRFNHYGQAYWYLASTKDAAVAEIVRPKERMAWVQMWKIERLDSVLDLRPWSADDVRVFDKNGDPKNIPLLAIGVIFGEQITSLPNRNEGWRPEYMVPRFLADAAKQAGFSAVLFKSPRHYDENLVCFNRDAGFEPIKTPRLHDLPKYLDQHREGIFYYQGFPQL